MSERRYNEAEVAAIFEQATKSQHTEQRHLPATGEGMTLAQIEEIGRDVGISSAEIRDAVRAVGQGGVTTSRRVLGLTFGVGRTVDLNRRLTEEEWERLVADLRETFDARGRVHREGSLRQWTNGNLQALLEPTETGQRVRLQTFKGQSANLMMGGTIVLAFAAVSAILGALGGAQSPAVAWATAAAMVAAGGGMIGLGAALLPKWARLRRQQMEDVAGRLVERTSE